VVGDPVSKRNIALISGNVAFVKRHFDTAYYRSTNELFDHRVGTAEQRERDDVAIAHRRQFPCNGDIILNSPHTDQGIRYAKSPKAKQRHKKNRFSVEVISNAAAPVSGTAVYKRLGWGVRLF
jgi:hypothetical protein